MGRMSGKPLVTSADIAPLTSIDPDKGLELSMHRLHLPPTDALSDAGDSQRAGQPHVSSASSSTMMQASYIGLLDELMTSLLDCSVSNVCRHTEPALGTVSIDRCLHPRKLQKEGCQ